MEKHFRQENLILKKSLSDYSEVDKKFEEIFILKNLKTNNSPQSSSDFFNFQDLDKEMDTYMKAR